MPLQRRHLLGAGLSALAAPPFIRHASAAYVPRFALGVASGMPQPTRLVLWTRLTGLDLPAHSAVRWTLAHDAACSRIAAQGMETADAGTAHSVHAEPGGLDPGRSYFYRFEALGQRSATGRTRTAPAADALSTLRAAIASCQRWDHGQWAAWRHIAQQDLDLVLFLGDYIYEYPSSSASAKLVDGSSRSHDGPLLRTLDQYRARYAEYKSDPALQAAHAACPWLLVWDDHEVDNDYAGDRGSSLQGPALLRLRAAAYQAWWEHQPVPKAMQPVGPDMRIYHRLDWGLLARIHALDDRQYRHPQACLPLLRRGGASVVNAADCPDLQDPTRSLLGAAQERWLDAGWDSVRPWNLLAQQTLMARRSRQPATGPGSGSRSGPDTGRDTGRYSTDGWDGYPSARQRLLASVAARQLGGVVALGGDVHAHHVADLKADFDDPASPVLASEVCGTSISSHGPAQSTLAGWMAHNPHLHYGRSDQRGHVLITLDTQQLQADLMAVQRPQDANSAVDLAARFVVQAGRPGPQRA